MISHTVALFNLGLRTDVGLALVRVKLDFEKFHVGLSLDFASFFFVSDGLVCERFICE